MRRKANLRKKGYVRALLNTYLRNPMGVSGMDFVDYGAMRIFITYRIISAILRDYFYWR